MTLYTRSKQNGARITLKRKRQIAYSRTVKLQLPAYYSIPKMLTLEIDCSHIHSKRDFMKAMDKAFGFPPYFEWNTVPLISLISG